MHFAQTQKGNSLLVSTLRYQFAQAFLQRRNFVTWEVNYWNSSWSNINSRYSIHSNFHRLCPCTCENFSFMSSISCLYIQSQMLTKQFTIGRNQSDSFREFHLFVFSTNYISSTDTLNDVEGQFGEQIRAGGNKILNS